MNQKIHDDLMAVAAQLHKTMVELDKTTMADLALDVDRQAMQTIFTDLAWAIENCSVIALHQIGEAMDDMMGLPRVSGISTEEYLRQKASRKSRQAQSLADGMEEMVAVMENAGLRKELDALQEKYHAVKEICEYGAAGPVGIGFGNMGGHAVGGPEDEA